MGKTGLNQTGLQDLVDIYNSYEPEKRLHLWKAITKYGNETHIVEGSTSLCGLWTGFGKTSNQVTCEKCLQIISKRISYHTPNGEEKQKMETKTQTVGETTTKENFKEKYHNLETLGDGWRLAESMSSEDLIEFRDAANVMKQFTGLDMREDWFLGAVESELDARAKGYHKEGGKN